MTYSLHILSIIHSFLLLGFKRKEFRGKLAIAITANFKNRRTTAEAVVEEISGVAFVYKQDFFNNLYEELGIALENIVYYKDETHYFVMTTKKHSLLDRGVLKEVRISNFEFSRLNSTFFFSGSQRPNWTFESEKYQQKTIVRLHQRCFGLLHRLSIARPGFCVEPSWRTRCGFIWLYFHVSSQQFLLCKGKTWKAAAAGSRGRRFTWGNLCN